MVLVPQRPECRKGHSMIAFVEFEMTTMEMIAEIAAALKA